MGDSLARRTTSFVVRLWQEPSRKGEKQEWRGQVEHIASGQAEYFKSLKGLLAFISKMAPGFVENVKGETPEADSQEPKI